MLSENEGTHDIAKGFFGPVRQGTGQLGFCEVNHASAFDKSTLAYWDDDELTKFIAGHQLVAYTAHTITTNQALIADLEKVRKMGTARISKNISQKYFARVRLFLTQAETCLRQLQSLFPVLVSNKWVMDSCR